jgi:hypothetical protein
MKPLTKIFIFSLATSSAIALTCPSRASAAYAEGGGYVITKTLWGAAGTSDFSADGVTLGLSMGEGTAGYEMSNSQATHASGYYAQWMGNGMVLTLQSWEIPALGPKIHEVQVGVTLESTIRLEFTDQVAPDSIAAGITLYLVQDRLGDPKNAKVPYRVTYNARGSTVLISPQEKWFGNTLYELYVNEGLRNLDGASLENPKRLRFLTVVDPREENVLWNPIDAPVPPATLGSGSVQQAPVSLHVPAETVADYSMILVNESPTEAPSRVDPEVIRDANKSALRSGGAYRVPLTIYEVNAYNLSRRVQNTLSKAAKLSIPYPMIQRAAAPGTSMVRPQTLSLWALDETHRLWVKIPDSQVNINDKEVSANISQFAVFAVMGQASGNAQDVFVFPTPWRPRGPNAGQSVGQSGSLNGGITFSNLPSECTIRIFTLAGALVRELKHSDVGGLLAQERWDGTTSSGDVAASGVYIWRVESASDSKVGKLMIIR